MAGSWKRVDVFYGKIQEPTLVEKWYGQKYQDMIVIGLLRGKRNGFFVDLAANDAQVISNTIALETSFGWDGLCIEPNPKYWYNHTRYRRCHLIAAIVGETRMEEIVFNYRGVLGGIVGAKTDNQQQDAEASLTSYTVPLTEILEMGGSPKDIDYLSLDVEGVEFYVMKQFPFHSYNIKILTVGRPTSDLKELLIAKGFVLLKEITEWGETVWAHQKIVDELDHSILSKIPDDEKPFDREP